MGAKAAHKMLMKLTQDPPLQRDQPHRVPGG